MDGVEEVKVTNIYITKMTFTTHSGVNHQITYLPLLHNSVLTLSFQMQRKG